jgi:hypothetical protein
VGLGAEPGNHQQISNLLTYQVDELIKESVAENEMQPGDPYSQPLGPMHSQEVKPMLPLIRLRVDYTGFSTIHSQRFGNTFKDRVANPGDILLWSKSSAPRCVLCLGCSWTCFCQCWECAMGIYRQGTVKMWRPSIHHICDKSCQAFCSLSCLSGVLRARLQTVSLNSQSVRF